MTEEGRAELVRAIVKAVEATDWFQQFKQDWENEILNGSPEAPPYPIGFQEWIDGTKAS